MRYVIYCDESDDKGRYYSNFYGGALLRASDRQAIEAELNAVKAENNLRGEAKWTKISEYNEAAYRAFADKIFEFAAAGLLKIRIMCTQNINQTRHLEYEGSGFFKLYYQFIKHAFGLGHCNPERATEVSVTVLLDDAPDTAEKLENFKSFLSGLSNVAAFRDARVVIPKPDIAEIDSSQHVILQAVDVVLGAMQFRLNDLHKEKPANSNRRGKRTRAKERVYKHILKRICEIYPNFNIGASTGHGNGLASRWLHPYRHWVFVPEGSIEDTSRGKRSN
ncbi:DUF3800 domain-containing protein [Sphingosinicella terrae]|uniref:DUF3800 domain-containing protein n=1 Tax=Sphingosinicella terrae TaxID=2172047 RepID=UPI000E0CE83D|nr:DUF3800 domain-containing protein [Sphingosinicella terrae]